MQMSNMLSAYSHGGNSSMHELGVSQEAQARNLGAPILAEDHAASATGTQP